VKRKGGGQSAPPLAIAEKGGIILFNTILLKRRGGDISSGESFDGRSLHFTLVRLKRQGNRKGGGDLSDHLHQKGIFFWGVIILAERKF